MQDRVLKRAFGSGPTPFNLYLASIQGRKSGKQTPSASVSVYDRIDSCVQLICSCVEWWYVWLLKIRLRCRFTQKLDVCENVRIAGLMGMFL